MAKQNKTSHIVEFRLKTLPSDIKAFNIRLEVARKLYNATLGELLRRDEAMRSEPKWFELIALNKTLKDKLKQAKTKNEIKALEKERKSISEQFSKLVKSYQVSEYALNSFSKDNRNACYFSNHLDANTVQKIDKRAFDAYIRWRFDGYGKPRFKGQNRKFKSVEGKTNKQGIKVRLGNPKYDAADLRSVTCIVWGGLELPLDLSRMDKEGYQEAALTAIGQNRVSYVRLIKRTYKGKERLYAQIVIQGSAFTKAKHRAAYEKVLGKRVGMDVGVSSLAYYSKKKAALLLGVNEIQKLSNNLKSTQKKASRLLRLANKDNYQFVYKYSGRTKAVFKQVKAQFPKATPEQIDALIQTRCTELNMKYRRSTAWQRKKGTRDNNKPKTWQRLIVQIKELHRKIAAKRKYLHYKYTNEILSCGTIIITEKINIKAWQKVFGKSILAFAPSQLLSILKRKAENAGGEVVEINTWKAKLSQYDHVNDTYVKKRLSERTVIVGGSDLVQRDLYSAYLAYCMGECGEKVNQSLALAEWSSARPRLVMAFSKVKERAKRGNFIPSSAGVTASCRAPVI